MNGKFNKLFTRTCQQLENYFYVKIRLRQLWPKNLDPPLALTLNWTISYGLCWNIGSRKTIWRPRAHFGSKNDSLKGLKMIVTYSNCCDFLFFFFGISSSRSFSLSFRFFLLPLRPSTTVDDKTHLLIICDDSNNSPKSVPHISESSFCFTLTINFHNN